MEDLLVMNLLFQISSDFVTFETNFRDGFLNQSYVGLKGDMPILTCIFFTFNWLTLTSEMHFVQFHPEVASCLLSKGKRKYAPWRWGCYENTYKEIIFWYTIYLYTFCYISKTTKNLKLKLWIYNSKNMGFHFISKNILLTVEPWGMRMWSA